MRIKHLLGIILLLLLQATPLVAQQLRTFRLTDFHRYVLDLTARHEQFRKADDSGSLYAIIKDMTFSDWQDFWLDMGIRIYDAEEDWESLSATDDTDDTDY